jgi:hypothetical protein
MHMSVKLNGLISKWPSLNFDLVVTVLFWCYSCSLWNFELNISFSEIHVGCEINCLLLMMVENSFSSDGIG